MATDGKLREASLDDNINESVDGELDENFSAVASGGEKIVSSFCSVCFAAKEKLIDFHQYSRRMLPKITIITFAENISSQNKSTKAARVKENEAKKNI